MTASLFRRIVIGKSIGFAFGLIGIVIMPLFWPDTEFLFKLGMLCWYTTMGAFIGLMGVITYHPILHIPLPWWFRSGLIGSWMNFVLLLFIYDKMQSMMDMLFTTTTISAWWFILEGSFVGLIMGYCATRFAGEGRASVDMDPDMDYQ